MANSKPLREPASAERRSKRPILWTLGAVLALCLSAGWWWVLRPWQWTSQADALLSHDPAQADALAEEVINLDTVRVQQAWLVRCRAQVALNHPLEALGAFAQIQHPESCDAGAWCALIEETLNKQQDLLADLALSAALKFSSERRRVLTLALPLKSKTMPAAELTALISELRRIAGEHAASWHSIGIAEQDQGRFAGAIEAYRQAVVLSAASQPIWLDARRSLSQLLILLGRFAEAEPLMTEVLSVSQGAAEDLVRMAQLKRAAGNPNAATELLNCVLERNSKDLTARLLRGTLRADQGLLAEAREDFEECLRLSPTNDEAHYRLSQVLRRQGRFADAETHATEHQRLSELKRRLLEISRRRELAPRDSQLMNELAAVYEQLGQPLRAAEWKKAADSQQKNAPN